MADSNELLFIMRMKDEASAVLAKLSGTLHDNADEHENAAKKLSAWKEALFKATGGAKTFGEAARNVTASMVSLGAPVAGGIVAANSLESAYGKVVGVLKEMISNTVEYEKSQKALSGAMRVNPAIGMTNGALNEYIDKVAGDTLTDDTDVRSAAAKMISIGRVTKETFDGAMQASIQLSRVIGTDLPSAARMMARAMADPEQGMNMLRRAGIMLNENEKERIKLMELSGGRMAAQSEALRILAERIGDPVTGSAGKGLSGAFKNAAFAWDEFLDQFNDSVLSKMTAGVVNLTAEVLKLSTVLKTPSEVEKKSAIQYQIDTRQAQIDRLVKAQKEGGVLNFLEFGPGQDANIKRIQKEVDGLKDKIKEMGAEAEKAFAGQMKSAIEQAADASKNLLVQMGQTQIATGRIVDKEVARADAALEGARHNLELMKKEYSRVFSDPDSDLTEKNRANKDLTAAEAAFQAAQGAARTAGEERKITLEREKQLELARTAQAERAAAQAGLEAYDRSFAKYGNEPKAKEAQRQAVELAKSREAMTRGDAEAAISREVRYQMELAEAYGMSASAANKLVFEQKAMEAAATGSGAQNARDMQSVEFFKALVSMAQETRKAVDSLPELESKVEASFNSTTQFAFQTFEQVLTKVRELKSKLIDDGSPEAQLQATKLLTEQTRALAEARSRAGLKIAEQNAGEVAKAQDEIELNRARIATAGQSQRAAEVAIAMVEREREMRKLLALDLGEEERAKRQAAIDARLDSAKLLAQSNEEVRKANGPLNQYLREAAEPWKGYEQAVVAAMGGTEDTLAAMLGGTRDWQASLHDLLNSVIHDLEKLAIRAAITGPIVNGLFGKEGEGSGGSIGSFLGKAASWVGGFFADGGIMTAEGRVPLRKYSGGGIANTPQLAMFGEGSTPEAYVPVPSGRIPVELNGASRGSLSMTTNITVNVGDDGGGKAHDPAGATRQAQTIAAAVKAALNKHMQNEMRPGGLLNPAGGAVM
jgi:hypothetical protein